MKRLSFLLIALLLFGGELKAADPSIDESVELDDDEAGVPVHGFAGVVDMQPGPPDLDLREDVQCRFLDALKLVKGELTG